jgi:hypothetical protein
MECGVIIMNYTNSKKYWTEEDRNTVLQMDIDGYTQHEIAKHIGRSYNSVRHVMATEEYKRNKEMTLNKLALSKTFEQGTVYTIEEMKDLSGIVFLPSNFVYEGKTQGRRAKHIFRSVNGGYLLTFTDIQLYGFIFREGGGDNAERLREDAGFYQERSNQKGKITRSSRQRGEADRRSYVEQTSSQESCYQKT